MTQCATTRLDGGGHHPERLRRHLTEERGVDRRMLSLSSYWTYGTVDD